MRFFPIPANSPILVMVAVVVRFQSNVARGLLLEVREDVQCYWVPLPPRTFMFLLFLHVVIPTCTYVYICILYPCHRYLAWLEQELITLSAKWGKPGGKKSKECGRKKINSSYVCQQGPWLAPFTSKTRSYQRNHDNSWPIATVLPSRFVIGWKATRNPELHVPSSSMLHYNLTAKSNGGRCGGFNPG